MNFYLTEEQKAIRETVRKFAQNEVAPRGEELDRTGEFPYDLVKRCAEVGIQGLLFSEELGGSNAGAVSYALAIEELARGDMSLAATILVAVPGCLLICERGTEEMIQKFVVPTIGGECIGSGGITEPEAGSDNRSIRTTAAIRGDQIIVNGTKSFITNPGTKISKFINVLCALESKSQNMRERQFCMVLIPKETPGYTVSQKYRKMGWRSSDTRECHFDDCVVPLENMLVPPGKGLEGAWGLLNMARIALAASSVGLAQASLDASLKYAKERVQFGKPIGSFQRVQDMLVEMALQIEASRLLTLQAAFLWEKDTGVQKEICMAKLFATEAAKRAADLGVQVHGGFGFMDEYAVSRYYRDVRVNTIGDGTSEIQRLIIARTLGLRG